MYQYIQFESFKFNAQTLLVGELAYLTGECFQLSNTVGYSTQLHMKDPPLSIRIVKRSIPSSYGNCWYFPMPIVINKGTVVGMHYGLFCFVMFSHEHKAHVLLCHLLKQVDTLGSFVRHLSVFLSVTHLCIGWPQQMTF